jgi:DNA-binding NarL/FixJ family response regulator
VTIRVLVADDHALVRAGFSLLVDNEPDMAVVGEAPTGAAAVSLTRLKRPDVVLMDVRMPELDGIEATRRIAADHQTAAARILILTTFDLDEYVFGAVRAGASGFLVKDTPPALLLDAIRVIAAGDALLTPSATRRLIGEFTRYPAPCHAPARALDGITDRERDVLLLVGQGRSNSEICQGLHISMATAKTHVGRLLTKLGARDRAQLVIAAYESGLINGAHGR